MTKLLRRLRYWAARRRMDAELAEEMEFHRALIEREGGPAAAMGNTTVAREDARAVWIWPWLESFWQDAVYGIRTLRRQPGFTITALVALGSAIGINTTLFTIFNSFALRPWAVRDPARVVTVHRFTREGGGGFGIAEYRYLAQHSQTFAGLIAMRNGEQVKIDQRPQQLTYVSGNYFSVLGVEIERGRGFLLEEDRDGAPEAVAVISHDLWQERFGGDARILGRKIRLDEIPFTIVGVTSPDFTGTNPLRNDIWTTFAARKLLRPNDPSVEGWLTSPTYCCTPIAGRLAPGITRKGAEAELAVLVDQFREANALGAQRALIVLAGTSWMDSPRKKRQVIPAMAALFLAVTLVLLLACANVGNLLLARAAARRQEIAIRLSLGGSRYRLIRGLLVESMILAGAAAGLGLAIAYRVAPAVVHRLADDQGWRVTPDFTVLLYTAGIAILACLAFGLAPALHGTRAGVAPALRADPAVGTSRLRGVLLTVQVAISVILLANAGVLVRGLERAQSLNPGFDVQNVAVLAVDLPASQYTGPRTKALTRNLLAELSRASDLSACGLALNPPLNNATYSTSFQRGDRKDTPKLQIYFNEVSGGYFGALGIPVLAGRTFVPEDSGRDVMIINEAAAKRWWPGERPLGKTAIVNERMREIIGVVGDTYTNDLSSVEAVLYTPVTGGFSTPFVLVRDRGAASVERIAGIVKRIEPRAQVRAEALAESFRRRMQPAIVSAELAGFFGLLALAIASVGMSGVFAYVVDQRTREIGVRMALGAQPPQIVRLVLASSLRALGFGLAAGIASAAASSMLLVHVVPGVKPGEPMAYISVVLLLSAAVAVATAVPARRATRIDPVRALRWE